LPPFATAYVRQNHLNMGRVCATNC